MKHTKIYALSDPISNQIRYIGLTTVNLNHRLNQHIYSAKTRSPTHRSKWINSLNKRPNILLIDEIISDEIEWWLEEYYINQFKTWGFNLVNSTNGGKVPITKSGKDNPNYGNKYNSLLKTTKDEIVQLDNDGAYIRTVSCAAEFEKYNIPSCNVSLCINKHRTNHKGFQFIRLKDYDENKNYALIPVNTQRKKVAQLDYNTLTIINTFDSITKASLHVINTSNGTSKIGQVCENKRKSYKGFKWCYIN
jgi:hypothetical protein